MRNRCLPILALVLLLFSLTACGQPAAQSDDRFPNRYSAAHRPLAQADTARCAAFSGETAYFVASESHTIHGAAEDFVETMDGLYAADAQGTVSRLEAFSAYQRQCYENGFSNHRVTALAAGQSGLWLVTQSSAYTDNGPGPLVCSLLLIDWQGGLVSRAGLGNQFSCQLTCDGEGYAYVLDERNIVQIFNPDGQKIGQISDQTIANGALTALADGRAAVVCREVDRYRILPIDRDEQRFSDAIELENALGVTNGRFYPGSGGYDLLWATGLSLYGYRLQSGTGEQLLTWLNCDIEGPAILALTGRDKGFACLFNSSLFGGELAELQEKTPAAPERTLTLACRGLPDQVSQAVLRFNRQDTGCRVVVKDYGALAVSGAGAGVDKMTVDMISGRMPDLICTDHVNVQTFLDQDLLEDLWPYIDADEGLGGRAGLVQPVFNALSREGKLYQIADGFFVQTAMGLTALMGDRQGWTLEEFQQFRATLAEDVTVFSPDINDQLQVMMLPLSLCAQEMAQREDGENFFDSDRYIAILEYTATFPAQTKPLPYEEQQERLRTGKQLLDSFLLTNPLWLVQCQKESFGGQPVTLTGIPGIGGNGSVFFLRNPMAMYAGCKNKADAWAFLRTLLLPESQRVPSVWWSDGSSLMNMGMPTNRAAFDAMMEDAMAWPENWTCPFPPMTPEQAEQFSDFLGGITMVQQDDPTLTTILYEEAQRYLDGLQTAEEAAQSARNRVKLYLGERE